MLELGVIADDLTGGMMVASLLEREGVRCPLVTSTGGLAGLDEDAQAVVIGRKIRLLPPQEAVADARRSAKALLAKQAKRIYYKSLLPQTLAEIQPKLHFRLVRRIGWWIQKPGQGTPVE